MNALHRVALDDAVVWTGTLPEAAWPAFEALWSLHPQAFHRIKIRGREVDTPRWQQAYGVDYRYTGTTNHVLPVPPEIQPLLSWCQRVVDPALNGVLINWYDGRLGHYIGPHRDSDAGRVPGSSVVIAAFGEARPLRLRPYRGKGYVDLPGADGGVTVIPWHTNRAWTHEVPKSRGATGRRISLSLRAFA